MLFWKSTVWLLKKNTCIAINWFLFSQIVSDGKINEVDTPHYLLQNASSKLTSIVSELGSAQTKYLQQIALEKHENRPYMAPPIDPDDFQEFPRAAGGDLKAPNNLNVLPTFHSSRLAGVLNQLPTNKFSTDRLWKIF